MSIVKGKIYQIHEEQTFRNDFKKRNFILDTGGDYPQKIIFNTFKSNTRKLDSLKIGDVVEVKYNIKGSENEGKYYVNLEAWSIQNISTSRANTKLEDDLPF